MAIISRIKLPTGAEYELADAYARSAIAGLTGGDAITLIGVSETALTDGGNEKPIIGGEQVNPAAGQLYFYDTKEFVYGNDNKWHELGNFSNLGALAQKSSASGSYQPEGEVSKPSFTGTEGNLSVKGTPSGSVSISTGNGTANYTPAGTVSQANFTGSPATISVNGTPTGTISTGTGTTNYTPAGTVSVADPTVTLTTTDKYVASSATSGGAVTAGTAAQYTPPTFSTTVDNEGVLTIGWTPGSAFTPNVPTAVTLPEFTSQSIATGVQSTSAGQATFSGTGVELKFTGDLINSTGNYTPAGSINEQSFNGTGVDLEASFIGTETTSTGKFTPAGEVSKPTFTGTNATITVS